MMDYIPYEICRFLQTEREELAQMGVVGCGLQLDPKGDYLWEETTLSFHQGNTALRVFLTVEGLSSNPLPGREVIRLSLLTCEEFVRYHKSIQDFLELYHTRKWVRLGRRARLPPWEMSSQDAFIITMNENDFENHFTSDPRGRLSHTGLVTGATLHDPIMHTKPGGLPDPRQGGWIRSNSIA